MIKKVLGYSQANTSPHLQALLGKLDQLKSRVRKNRASRNLSRYKWQVSFAPWLRVIQLSTFLLTSGSLTRSPAPDLVTS